MASEKRVIAAGKAYSGIGTTEALAAETAQKLRAKPPEPPESKGRWKFVKTHGVMDKLKFPDGGTYQFRLIERNDGSGYAPMSHVVTDDEKLANNLRDAMVKNPLLGIQEEILQQPAAPETK